MTKSNTLQFRADVQVLRALAVLLVIFFHAKVPGFGGGFLGVDIFFVISGFWMSTILIKELESGAFSFASFYERRLRRILPALYMALFLVLIVSWFELWPRDFDTMSRVMGSAVLFLANAVIRNQADDYFAPEMDSHPLLHIWSLSLEEQFYLLFPLILLLIYKSPYVIKRAFIWLIPIASFYTAIHFYQINPTATFYHLPARVWEFWLGYGAARWVISNKGMHKSSYRLAIVVLLASVFLVNETAMVPGFGSLAPAVSTAIILSSTGAALTFNNIFWKAAVWIGGISYSLYLLHQPILSFLRLRGYDSWPVLMGMTLLFGLVGSQLIKKFVEDPFRNKRKVASRSFWSFAVIVGGILFLIALWGVKSKGIPQRFDGVTESITSTAHGSPERGSCHDREVADSCVHFGNASPTYAVLGDSHSVALAYAVGELLKENNQSALHLSVSGCGFYTKYERCNKWYQDAIDRIVFSESIQTVVISMRIASQLHGKHKHIWPNIPDQTDKLHKQNVKEAYSRVFERLLDAGKKVIWVLQVPEVGPKLETQMRIASQSENASAASVTLEWWRKRMKEVKEFSSSLPKEITVFDPESLFCRNKTCFAVKNGITLYRDRDHMSLSGARLIAKAIKNLIIPL